MTIASELDFKSAILEGIPKEIPAAKPYETDINHAPKRVDLLNEDEKKLALQNALRYFPKEQHEVLAKDFANELKEFTTGKFIVKHRSIWY